MDLYIHILKQTKMLILNGVYDIIFQETKNIKIYCNYKQINKLL